MRKYIVDLTNDLITKNKYDKIQFNFPGASDGQDFLRYVYLCLLVDDVKSMRPETLGRIMCAFEVGDVQVTSNDLAQTVKFAGDCEQMLRQIVSLTLAHAIMHRLQKEQLDGVPAYRRYSKALSGKV